MPMYGKATETAIAAVGRLAEVYDEGETRLSASEIAEARSLQQPFVAKVLTRPSQESIVHGSRGPGGGFTLARHPREILLYDVIVPFERESDTDRCPFGGGRCGVGEPCPLHDKLVDVELAVDRILLSTSFDAFRRAHKQRKT